MPHQAWCTFDGSNSGGGSHIITVSAMQAGEPGSEQQLADSSLPSQPRSNLADSLAADVLQTLQAGAGLTRRPSRVDNHQLDVRPLGEGSMRVVHVFDAHFDAPLLGGAAAGSAGAIGGLRIEEVGSGDMSDGVTPDARRPPPALQPAGQQQLAPQGLDAVSQTEEAQLLGGHSRQLSHPTLASVNNSLFRNNLTR